MRRTSMLHKRDIQAINVARGRTTYMMSWKWRSVSSRRLMKQTSLIRKMGGVSGLIFSHLFPIEKKLSFNNKVLKVLYACKQLVWQWSLENKCDIYLRRLPKKKTKKNKTKQNRRAYYLLISFQTSCLEITLFYWIELRPRIFWISIYYWYTFAVSFRHLFLWINVI